MPDSAQDVFLVDPVGKVISTSPDLAAQFLQSGMNYAPASPEQMQHYQYQQALQSPGSKIEAGAEGFGRGATFGATDALGRLVGFGEHMKEIKEANPVTAMGGELTGMFAPAILTGGGSLLERAGVEGAGELAGQIGRFTGPGIAGKLGETVGAGVAKALPNTKWVLDPIAKTVASPIGQDINSIGNALVKATIKGTQGAAEFGALGAGQAVSEDALKDPQNGGFSITSASLMRNIGTSALIGGVVGGGFSLLGSGISRGADKLNDVAFNIRKAQTLGEIAPKGYGIFKDLTFIPGQKLSELAFIASNKIGDRAAQEAAVNISGQSAKIAEAVKSDVNASTKRNQDAAKQTEGYARNAEEGLKDNSTAKAAIDDEFGSIGRAMNNIPGALKRDTVWGPEIRNLRDTFKAENLGENKVSKLYETSTKLEEMAARFGEDKLPNEIKALRDRLSGPDSVLRNDSYLGPGSSEAVDLNSAVLKEQIARANLSHDIAEKVISKDGGLIVEIGPQSFKDIAGGDPIKMESLKSFYDATSNLNEKINTFMKATGRFDINPGHLETVSNKTSGFFSDWNAAREADRIYKGATSTSDIGDLAAGAAGVYAGKAAGSVLTGAGLPNVLPHVGGAYAAAKLFKYAINNPNEAAFVISKLYGMTMEAQNVIAKGAVAAVKGDTQNAGIGTSSGVSASVSKDTAGIRKAYTKAVEEISSSMNNPERLAERLAKSTETISKYAPGVAGAFHADIARTLTYMQAQIPKVYSNGMMPSKVEPSVSQQADFLTKYEIAMNPEKIFSSFKSGTMTQAQVETLQNCHPEYYKNVVNSVSTEIANKDVDKIPYRNRMMISLFMGRDLDGSLHATLANQATYVIAKANPGLGQSIKSAPAVNKLSMPDRFKTDSQDVATRKR